MRIFSMPIILQNFFESKEYVVDTNTNYKSVIAKLLKNKCITDEDIPIKDGLENKLLEGALTR